MTVQLTKIISVVEARPSISTKELAEIFGTTNGIMGRKLCELLKQGYIERTSVRPSHWVVTKGACTPTGNRKSNWRMIEYNGETMHLKGWCRKLNLDYSTVGCRLDNGWSVERAFETPCGSFKERVKE